MGKLLPVTIVLLTHVFLISCASTGGTIGGLVPAPKFTKGELNKGKYLAQDSSFSVATPFQHGSSAYTYMEISEKYSETENIIQFSSSYYPAEVYRIRIYKNPRPGEGLEQLSFESYRQSFESAYGTQFVNRKSKKALISGVEANIITHSQHIPERESLGQKAMSFDALHTCVYLEKNNNAAFLCANRMVPSENLARGAEERVSSFIASFEM